MWMLLTLLLISFVGAVCKYLPMIIPPIGRDAKHFVGNMPRVFCNTKKELERDLSSEYPSGDCIAHRRLDELRFDDRYKTKYRAWPKTWGWVPDIVDEDCEGFTENEICTQNGTYCDDLEKRQYIYKQWVYTGDFRDDWHFPVIKVENDKWFEISCIDQNTDVVTTVMDIPDICQPEKSGIRENPPLGTRNWKYVSKEDLKKEAAKDRKKLLTSTLPALWNKFIFYDEYWEIIQEYIWHIEPWRPSDDEIISSICDWVRCKGGLNSKNAYAKVYEINPVTDYAFYTTYFVPPLSYEQMEEVRNLCTQEDIKPKFEEYQKARTLRNAKIEAAIKQCKKDIKEEKKRKREEPPAPTPPPPPTDEPKYLV